MNAGVCLKCGDPLWNINKPCDACAKEACEIAALRDKFAAAALSGRLANERLTNADSWNENGGKYMAQDAYKLADAMMAERER